MSDLAATNCGCGCEGSDVRGCGCGNNSCLWIIILLFCCGGNSGFGGNCGSGCGGCGDNSCIFIILLLLCCCGNGCGSSLC